MKAQVFVPATSANLGAGFDILGLAVNLYNEFYVETSKEFEFVIEKGPVGIPNNRNNLFYRSFSYLFEKVGRNTPSVKITMRLNIPQGRGLGSSATAVVGGLIAANAFLNNKFSKDQLLPFAVELENGQHPDNVAPALFGGLIVSAVQAGQIMHVKVPFPQDIKAVFFIPDFEMDTVTGRKLMPQGYSKTDLTFGASRVGLLLAALQTRKYQMLKTAMQDRTHQPTRAKIFPAMPYIIRAADHAGAYGAALSGGGSSIIALADKNFIKIGLAMKQAALDHGVNGKPMVLEIVNEGTFSNRYVKPSLSSRPLVTYKKLR